MCTDCMKENTIEHFLTKCDDYKLERKDPEDYLQKTKQKPTVEIILQVDNNRKILQLAKQLICQTKKDNYRTC